jgi:hypothetical protein
MSVLCNLFGHKLGKSDDRRFVGDLRLSGGPTDKYGVERGLVESKCDRCGEWFPIGRLHLMDGVVKYRDRPFNHDWKRSEHIAADPMVKTLVAALGNDQSTRMTTNLVRAVLDASSKMAYMGERSLFDRKRRDVSPTKAFDETP